MNKLWIFQVSAIFWNLWLSEKNVLYRKGTYPTPLTDGPWPRQPPRWLWPGQHCWPLPGTHRRRAADDDGEARELPRMSERAKKIKEILGNLLVAAPPQEGHRSDAGDHVLRRRTAAYDVYKLRWSSGCNKTTRRCASSPGNFPDARGHRLWTELTAISSIPASCCKGEQRISGDSNLLFSIPSSWRA
jgi:hypothetical protein